jgi:glycine amidinotransferase
VWTSQHHSPGVSLGTAVGRPERAKATVDEDAAEPLVSPVNSHNEWDPLEEIVVGCLHGATVPSRHPVVTCNIPPWAARAHGLVAGFRYPRVLVERAQHELDQFIALLRSLGITVRRPDAVDHRRRFGTPDWSSRGFCNTCPRDSLLVIGDEIIETPMAWPCRYFETHSYRPILKDYLRRGARWTAAPKPQLTEALYEADFRVPEPGEPMRYILTEFEPVFDAADFVRAGRDLFVTRSNVTNRMGIEWLRRHLGPGYRIHEIESRCRTPMHIDTTFVPLAPGKVLVNPEYIDVDRLPDVLNSWDVLVAPDPDPIDSGGSNRSRATCCTTRRSAVRSTARRSTSDAAAPSNRISLDRPPFASSKARTQRSNTAKRRGARRRRRRLGERSSSGR